MQHVHLLTDAEDRLEVGGFMQKVAGEFARAYNKRKGRVNASWGDNFHAILVDMHENPAGTLEETIAREHLQRKAYWTESLAVGRPSFLEWVKPLVLSRREPSLARITGFSEFSRRQKRLGRKMAPKI